MADIIESRQSTRKLKLGSWIAETAINFLVHVAGEPVLSCRGVR